MMMFHLPGQKSSCNCGVANTPAPATDSRIAGGEETEPNEYICTLHNLHNIYTIMCLDIYTLHIYTLHCV